MRETLRLAFILCAAAGGCTHRYDGPTPLVSVLSPDVACGAQLPTDILIKGSGLSPLADLLQTTSQVELPQFVLSRTEDESGHAVDPTTPGNSVLVPNDPRHPDLADESWTDQQNMTLKICPPGTCSSATPRRTDYPLPTGLYTLSVTNRNQKSAALPDALAIAAPPSLDSMSPAIACPDQDTTLTFQGDFFLRIAGAPASVTIADKSFPAASMTGCRPLPSPGDVLLEACTGLTAIVPAQIFSSGIAVDVAVKAATGCKATRKLALGFLTAPTVAAVSPDLVCLDDRDQTVTLTGSGFLTVDGALPSVTLGARSIPAAAADGCVAVDTLGPAHKVKSCSTLTFHLAQAAVPTGTYTLAVNNPSPAACSSQQMVGFAIVPRPKVTSLDADLSCNAGRAETLSITGSDFLVVDGTLPAISLGGAMTLMATAANCTDVTGLVEKVQRCTTLGATIPKGALTVSSYDVSVANPPPASAASTNKLSLQVLPAPVATAITPDLNCNSQGDSTFTITGANFIAVNGAPPTVVGEQGTLKVSAAAQLVHTNCVASTGPSGETLESCPALQVTFPKGTLGGNAAFQFAVTNAKPIDCAGSGVSAVVAQAPSVQSAPKGICTSQGAATVSFVGSDFFQIDNSLPTATFTPTGGGTPFTVSSGITLDDCAAFSGIKEMGQVCGTLSVTVPQGQIPAGTSFTVAVTNPGVLSACSSNGAVTVTGAVPPLAMSASPAKLCVGGGTLTVAGTNLEVGSHVLLGAARSATVSVTGGTSAVASFDRGLKPGGPYDVTFLNASGCSSTVPAAVSITPGPGIFFADPPVAWNGVSTPLTVYTSGVTAPVKSLALVLTGTSGPPISLTFTADARHPGHLNTILPVGIADGTYDLVLQDQTACPAILMGAVHVAAATPLTINDVTPAFGSKTASTAIRITGAGGFEAIPHAWLLGPTGALTPLGSIGYTDAGHLSAVVPALGNGGKYDLIVSNPDGGVGVLMGAFTATDTPPPLLFSVVPPSASTAAPSSYTIVGKGIAATATVSLTCFDTANNGVAAPSVTQGPWSGNCSNLGGPQCIPFAASFTTAGYCLVRVTNPDESFFDFSSLVVTGPSVKLGAFAAGPALHVARRAPALVTAGASPGHRFLYAIGGDSGTETGAIDSVEAIALDGAGRFAPGWTQLRTRLARPRTLHGAAALGRGLYAIGGSDGTGAVKTVERAYVLDPAAAPAITDFDVVPSDGSAGLRGGFWSYRIAALLKATDAMNPGGETLASDPLVIQVPDLQALVKVPLVWSPIAGAGSYRVYRTPKPDQSTGSELLIADKVATTNYTDAGVAPMTSTAPLALGATGVWTAIGALVAPRSGAAVTVAPDVTQPNVSYLYVIGGNSGTASAPNPVSTYGYVKISVDPNTGLHTAGTWSQGGAVIGAPRWLAGGYSAVVGGQAYIWAGAGVNATGGAVPIVDGAQVTAGSGAVLSFTTLGKPMGSRAGYGAVATPDTLLGFGGALGMADSSYVAGQISVPPQVGAWSTATGLVVRRQLPAAALWSAFILVAGGKTDSEAATTSVESVIW